jgi:hypothetical protein
MKLEDQISWQVSNFELSKRLKELGVKQESIFYWTDVACYHELPELPQPEPMWIIVNPISGKDEMSEDAISAFTVAELGEGLPEKIEFTNETGISSKGIHNLYFWSVMGIAKRIYCVGFYDRPEMLQPKPTPEQKCVSI